MNCTFCGKALSVHLLDPGAGGWQDRLYCSACRSFQHLPGDASCPYCSGTYRHFLATGRLGCAHCYDAFAEDLEPLVEEFRGKGGAPGRAKDFGYAPDRLAVARSQEIVRILENAAGPPGNDSAGEYTRVPIVAAADDPGPRSDPDPAGKIAEELSAAGTRDGRPGPAPGREPARPPAPGQGAVGGGFETMLERSRGTTSAAPAGSRPPHAIWRIRVARNIVGLPYRLPGRERELLDAILLGPGSTLAAHLPGGLGPIVTGAELAGLQSAGIVPKGARAAAVGVAETRSDAGPEDFWVYTGDEDHLRLQWRGRLELARLETNAPRFDQILKDITKIDELFAFQFHPEYGFLTACPGIGGSGLRVSCLISVHNLVSSGIWGEYRRRLLESGLEVRGGRGEEGGTSVEADGLVQISNRFWPAGTDFRAAIGRMLMIARRIGAADFQENPGDF